MAVALVTTIVLGACTSGSGSVATTTTAPITTTVPATTTTTEVPMEVGRQLFVYTPEAGHCLDLRSVETGARNRIDANATRRNDDQVVLLLDCTQPHQYEVAGVAEVPFPPAEWPGQAALEDQAKRLCPPVFDQWVGTAYERSELDIGWILPTVEEWGPGRQSVACLVYDSAAGLLTGTTQGAAR
ncbi:septum formation family protein [Rhabdothermincola salaria]|uniref:septum formation family protein n=1 Tax=Rhabdothermincola salaria TaxID=2903142 RepID=UPI001E5F1A50|nr:septum formation family protein [Rhabdothermincola salaria]MCD9625127.1 septum formation family protein [Rhabdothermincola salaria]